MVQKRRQGSSAHGVHRERRLSRMDKAGKEHRCSVPNHTSSATNLLNSAAQKIQELPLSCIVFLNTEASFLVTDML
jgi:hypothetical protein